MKRVIASSIIMLIISGIVTAHTLVTVSLAEKIDGISKEVQSAFENSDWEKVDEKLNKIKTEWEKKQMWAYLTLSTAQIDEIEISLEQSIAYAKNKATDNFSGEFKMFCMLIEHLPKRETFSIGELL